MSQHTPGPWEAERDDCREEYSIGHRRTKIGQRLIATVAFGFDEPAESEQHANALLIAAAPALATALLELLPEVDSEIEQRKHSGNAEDWEALEQLSTDAHAALRAAGVTR